MEYIIVAGVCVRVWLSVSCSWRGGGLNQELKRDDSDQVTCVLCLFVLFEKKRTLGSRERRISLKSVTKPGNVGTCTRKNHLHLMALT